MIINPYRFAAAGGGGGLYAPVTISADTDVLTEGNLLYAYSWTLNQAVNGVLFTAADDQPTPAHGNYSIDPTNINANGTAFGFESAPYSSLSAEYKNILKGAIFGNTVPFNFTLRNLTPGVKYKVQLWVSDSRSLASSRFITVNLNGEEQVMNFNSTANTGGVGQYCIGEFTAQSTTQDIEITGNVSFQINAFQVRTA